jgi:hypothetical protein
MVSFVPRHFHPGGKSPQYPLDRRLGGAQSRSGRNGEDNLALAGNRTGAVQPVTLCYSDSSSNNNINFKCKVLLTPSGTMSKVACWWWSYWESWGYWRGDSPGYHVPGGDNGGEARGENISSLMGRCLAFKISEVEG